VQTDAKLDLMVLLHAYGEAHAAQCHRPTDEGNQKLGDAARAIYAQFDALLALTATCTCATTYATYEGPEVDCPVHGAVRALAEMTRERDEWKRKATPAA
jgi:hypothetical protein